MKTPGVLWPLMSPPEEHGLAELCAVSAKGVEVTFAGGRKLLCGTSGMWNTPLGYGNEAIAAAAGRALREASYLSVWGGENVYARQAAEALVQLAGSSHFARVLFSTSGGAANDMAMKLARQYQVVRGEKDRNIILGLHGGYHGLTYGAFALTSGQLGQKMYGVDRRLVGHVHPNDVDELRSVMERIGDRVAAVVLEPVLGTGAIVLDEGYLAELFRQRTAHGFLLVADEVTTGFARVGPGMFASQAWAEPADVLITAKGLTNGAQAASALIVSDPIARAFTTSAAVLAHAETQAGTPVVCAAILATIDEMERLDVLTLGATLSRWLDDRLPGMMTRAPLVTGTNGRGCLRAIQLSAPDGRSLDALEVAEVLAEIRRAGALVSEGPSCIQVLPALVYSEDDLEELLEAITVGLSAYAEKHFVLAEDSF